MPPVCSIIVPVHDDPGFLAEALASARAQTLPDWELIVVDDGSTIGDPETAVRVAGDERIRLVRHETNRGPGAARNTGIRAARTDVIVTLDADDRLASRFLEAVVPLLAPETPYNCVFTDIATFGSKEGLIRKHVDPDLSSLLRFQWLPGPGVAFRRSLWEAAGGYAEVPELRAGNEDRDFWVAAFGAGLRPAHVAEALYHYRMGHASLMSKLYPVAWRTHEVIVDRHRDLFEMYGARRAFLADGYVQSADAMRVLGHRRRAIGLALRALAQDWLRLEALGVIGRALIPSAIHRGLRTGRRRLRGGGET